MRQPSGADAGRGHEPTLYEAAFLSGGCPSPDHERLTLARVEEHPYTRWPSPAGQRLLGALAQHTDGAGDDRTFLTSVAVRGVRAVGEPELRAAFAERAQHWHV